MDPAWILIQTFYIHVLKYLPMKCDFWDLLQNPMEEEED